MKLEWKKVEKNIYQPKTSPEIINIPKFNFFSIKGSGNPNDDFFVNYVGVLYTLSYSIRMSNKSGNTPENYNEYTVYPLEGVWDISDEAKTNPIEKFDKNTLVFNLMIRQPNFVTAVYANEIIKRTKIKKPNPLLNQIKFESIEEGKCIQMLHLGSYDSETVSFKLMEEFAEQNNLKRISKTHREIYLSDPRKTSPEKLKTILRFSVA